MNVSFLGLQWQITVNLVALNNRNSFFHSSGARRLKSRCWQGCTPFKCSAGKAFLATSSFWLVPAILVVPSLVDASLQSLPPSAHGLLPCVSDALCQNFSLLINTRVPLYLGPSRIQYDLVLTWWHLPRHDFQIKSHSQVPVDKNFWGTLFNPVKEWIWNLLTFSVADESC